MIFPEYRPRRFRQNNAFRRMIRETALSVDDLILPLFVVDGKDIKNPISAMPGYYRLSVDNLVKTAKEAFELGIPAVMLFGGSDKKNNLATSAYAKTGIVQKAVKTLKNTISDLLVITDVCLCRYTDHGHCGVMDKNLVDNDGSLDLLARTAVSHAQAGADMVAPSDMMDGRVAEIRATLDDNQFSNVPIISYAAVYSSAFNDPLSDASNSTDRSTYQMDPANAVEAIREATMDIEEGADVIMVKPALSYLDVIYRLREETDLPIAAFNSGSEYAMIKASAQRGWIDEQKIIFEMLTSIKRAGADMIVTPFAIEAAKKIKHT